MGTWTAEEQREHRKLWVEALRSGKYRQTDAALRRGDGFCCLGVACDISGLGEWSDTDVDGKVIYRVGEEPAPNYLPKAVVSWLGVAGYNPRVKVDGGTEVLAMMNDNGSSFTEIADIIESEPEGLLATAEASS